MAIKYLFRTLSICFILIVPGSHTAFAQEIYGAAYQGRDGLATLYRIDPLNGSATAIGSGIGFERVSGLAFHPSTGILYGIGERDAEPLDINVLITIDLVTGVGTEVGPTGTNAFQGVGSQPTSGIVMDLSFRRYNQSLFGFAYPGEWVANFDPASGAGTQLAFSEEFLLRGLTGDSGNALAFLGTG